MICSFIYTVWAHGRLCGIYYCLLLWSWGPSRLAPMPLTCQLHFKPFSLPDTSRSLAVNCQHYPTGTCFSRRQVRLPPWWHCHWTEIRPGCQENSSIKGWQGGSPGLSLNSFGYNRRCRQRLSLRATRILQGQRRRMWWA